MAPEDPSTKPPSSLAGSAGGVWQPPAPEELKDYFPQYEIVALLGRGGMGAVYKGWQRSLDRFVAIKILPPGLDDDDAQFTERFKQEAKSMAKLMHPGIVAVFDAGETPTGLLYFVMEFVEGTDVAHMVQQQGKLPPEHALAITAHVCDALQYAHTHGIVHRDIKPANIMVNLEGAVKVADFGLAKHSDPAMGGLTKTNMAMGTPDYVAPEALIAGMNVDGRADIYAVGVMLYQMLTGNIPRGMFTMPSIMVQTDPRFDRIIAKSMQTDREQRYESAAMLRRDLDVILTVPLVKAGDAHSSAAIPKQQLPQKPVAKQPQKPQGQQPAPGGPQNRAPKKDAAPAAAPAQKSQTQNPKSKTVPIIGIAAAVIVLGALAFLFTGKKPAAEPDATAAAEASTKPAPPIKVAEASKPPPVSTPAPKPAASATVPTTAAASAASATVKWRDWVADRRAAKSFNPPIFQDDGKELQWSQYGAFDFVRVAQDAAVRVTWTPTLGDTDTALSFRGLQKFEGVSIRVPSDGTLAVHHWNANGSGQNKLLKSFAFPAGIDPKAEHTLEVRLIGSMLSAWVNGQSVGSVDNVPVWEGSVVIYGHPGLVVKKLEYAVLDGVSEIPAAPSAAISATPPATATKDAPFINTLGMKFVPVPITGGPTDKQRVLFSVWETRAQDFEAFVKEAGHKWSKPTDVDLGPTHAVAGVSWQDATAFCAWLTRKERSAGRLAGNEVYRLPTDHEWSCAVGIGEQEDAAKLPSEKTEKLADVFPWGSQWPPPANSGNYWSEELRPLLAAGQYNRVKGELPGYRDGQATVGPVGSYGANRFGLYDLGGSVWEWCEDWWDKDQKARAIRGGSWPDHGRGPQLSSHRGAANPGARDNNDGFRSVLAPMLAETPKNNGPVPTTAPAKTTPAETKAAAAPMPPAGGSKTAPAPAADPVAIRLAEIEKQFLAAYAQQVTAAHTAAVAGLNTSYIARLDRDTAAASKASQLDDALALRNEKQQVATQSTIPAEDAADMRPVLKPLRKTYRDTMTTLIANRDKLAAPLHTAYDKALSNYQDELTQAQKLDEAARVKAVREQIAADRGRAAAPPAAATGPTPTNPPSTALAGASALPSNSSLSDATKDKPFTNSLGMKFVPVPGTDVLFCIHETRRQDYAAYAAAEPGVGGAWKNVTNQGVPVGGGDDHPVVGITWNDAQGFCVWLSRKEGRVYRLPTDREWSYAVGVGRQEAKNETPSTLSAKDRDEYPWGNKWPPPQGAGNYPDSSTTDKIPSLTSIKGYSDGYPTTAPVMSFKPNKVGIFDLGGNVWEWCDTWYEDTKTNKLLRGGNWRDDNPIYSLSSYRRAGTVGNSPQDNYGFRLVLDLKTPAAKAAAAPAAPPVVPPIALPAATKDKPFINSLGMKFIPVPDAQALFCIHETRRQDYAAFANEVPGVNAAWKDQQERGVAVGGQDDHPVVAVSWDDAQAFCAWLSKKESRLYRLPTDREWSMAVGIAREEKWKADTTPFTVFRVPGEYPWGDKWPPPKDAGNYCDLSYKEAINPTAGPPACFVDYKDGFSTTAPVMSFKPNRYGLYDLGGNVWEWVEDWFDPVEATRRTTRGACWSATSGLPFVTSSVRGVGPPGNRWYGNGFRVVLAPPAPKP